MNITGNNKIPSLTTPPPNESKGFMAAARYLFNGVKLLSKEGHEAVIACAFLAAQALECLLKAYLVKKGIGVNILKNNYGHDLKKLWEEAANKELGISRKPPVWCLILNQTHNKPYVLRYPTEINGFSVPACSEMVTELRELIKQVEDVI
jgi:HEPN domain-containing protein